jgi:hypothetical protein
MLPIGLLVVYCFVAIANLVFGFLNSFPASQDGESDSPPSASNLRLFASSLGIFCLWLGLAYLNTRFMGFYSLLCFYGLIAIVAIASLPGKRSKYNYAITALGLWVYPELLLHYKPALSEHPLQAIGLLAVVSILSIAIAIFWVLFSGIGVYGFIFTLANRQKEENSNNSQFSFILKSIILAFLAIVATVPLLISLLQAKLLGINFTVILWININFTLTNTLIFLAQKFKDSFTLKMPEFIASLTVVTLAWGGLIAGYLLSPDKLYLYQKELFLWIGISLAVGGLLTAIAKFVKPASPQNQ